MITFAFILGGLGDFIIAVSLFATDFMFMVVTALTFAMTEDRSADNSVREAQENALQPMTDEKTEV